MADREDSVAELIGGFLVVLFFFALAIWLP